MKNIVGSLLFITSLVFANNALADFGDAQTRDYTSMPAGTTFMVNFLRAGKADRFYSDGERVTGLGLEADLLADTLVVGHFYELFGLTMMGKVSGSLIRTKLSSNFDSPETTTGFSDPVFSNAVWLVDNNEDGMWFVIEPYISFPWGSYNENKPDTSPGENAYKVLTDINFTKRFGSGTYVELWYEFKKNSPNDRYFGQTLKKDRSDRYAVLFSQDLPATSWTNSHFLGMRYAWRQGGQEYLDGVKAGGRDNNQDLTVTYAAIIGQRDQLKLSYLHNTKARNGFAVNGVELRWARMF
ncbi:transporter [Marinobacter sp. KMM 10035]|uniref:transporter n=1 Tax=Marinobacter sp. KMM 10035 TaxID=3134034 RepID=UPI00397A232C